jgi:hypothetical protein
MAATCAGQQVRQASPRGETFGGLSTELGTDDLLSHCTRTMFV